MTKINILLLVGSMLVLSACGDDTVSEEILVSDGSVITVDANQTIGYKPNTDVQIINLYDGSYYITCDGAEDCSIHIGDVDNNSDSSSNADNNSSIG